MSSPSSGPVGPAAVEQQDGVLGRAALRRVVVALCLTQITSWGVLYYAFPVLASDIAVETGWSLMSLTAAFSAGQVVAAFTGIMVGRTIDRFGPRVLMTSASVLAVPAVAVIATATTYPAFLVGWLLAGAAMAGVLYPPAFTALTAWGGALRVRALTTVTLVAGLASTVFAPLAAVLNEHLGWRDTYLLFAGVLAVTTIPVHWFGLHAPWVPAHTLADRTPAQQARAARGVWTSRPFVMLALSMSAVAFCVYAVIINLVPLLTSRGLSTQTAAVALGVVGIGQVAGRIGYAAFAARAGVAARTTAVFAAVAVTTALLALLPGPAAAFMVVAALAGAARGVFTLVQATAVADRWGRSSFGRLHGILTAPVLLASSVAPFAGTALAEATGSQTRAFLLLAGLASAAVLLVRTTIPPPRGSAAPGG